MEEKVRKEIHDCNNSLAVMLGYAQLIGKIETDEKTLQYSQKIAEECKKIESKLKQIRSLVVTD